MSKTVQAIRGMNDILPDETCIWQSIEKAFIDAAKAYHYREIRFPIVEYQHLFSRSIGDVTDIVEKEMYTFPDRHGEMLALRPEGTAGCVRAAIQQNLLYNQTQRLWYLGPMFRYERPQQGRYRQFHQFGLESFGFAEAFADVEVIALSARVWRNLEIQDNVRLEINSLGSLAARSQYRAVLVDYFKQHFDSLDEDSQRRLDSNPLRILDSKNPAMRELIQAAPQLQQHIDADDKAHFEQVLSMLEQLNLPYTINPCLVRGLDYYNRTVFEWVTDDLGAQGTICAGGRYDDLVAMLGGKATPAVGFAAGIERIVELIKKTEHVHRLTQTPDIYFVSQSDQARAKALQIAESLRLRQPHLTICQHLGEGSFKSQFKRADQSGAKVALILAEEELQQNQISIKFLREDKPQQVVAINELENVLVETMRGDYARA